MDEPKSVEECAAAVEKKLPSKCKDGGGYFYWTTGNKACRCCRDKSNALSKGATSTNTHVYKLGPAPTPSTTWTKFNSYCVAKDGEDLQETNWKAGEADLDTCKKECDDKPHCSGLEWSAKGIDGAKCKLMLTGFGAKRPAKGEQGEQYEDVECYVRKEAFIVYWHSDGAVKNSD